METSYRKSSFSRSFTKQYVRFIRGQYFPNKRGKDILESLGYDVTNKKIREAIISRLIRGSDESTFYNDLRNLQSTPTDIKSQLQHIYTARNNRFSTQRSRNLREMRLLADDNELNFL